MADWRLAIEKVLEPEKPHPEPEKPAVTPEKPPKPSRAESTQKSDHRQVVDPKENFSAGRFMGVYPVSTRINLPAETRIDTGVFEGVEVDPVFPVLNGASIKQRFQGNLPTYNSISLHLSPPTRSVSHSHSQTHQVKPEKPDKPLAG